MRSFPPSIIDIESLLNMIWHWSCNLISLGYSIEWLPFNWFGPQKKWSFHTQFSQQHSMCMFVQFFLILLFFCCFMKMCVVCWALWVFFLLLLYTQCTESKSVTFRLRREFEWSKWMSGNKSKGRRYGSFSFI